MSSLPPAARPVRGELLCRTRSGATQTYALEGEQTLLGREPGLGVSVAMEGISRRHARISFDGKHYWLEDLKSTNGTFLNGQAVRRDRLRHLDVITLGKKLDLLFVLRSAEERPRVKRHGIVRAALVPPDPAEAPHEVGVGETTLGRSAACNVQAESGTVSKVHAQVRRTLEQLVVQDLGSSNGTFVNGSRVSVAELRDGDVLSLAGVEEFKVVVELGEVTTSSGSYAAPAPESLPAPAPPRFSNAWKTRFEWDSQELKQIAEAQLAGAAKAERTIMPKAAGAPTPMPSRKPGAQTQAPAKAEATIPPAKPPAPSKPPAPAPKPAGPPETATPQRQVRPPAATPAAPRPPAAAPPPAPAPPAPAPPLDPTVARKAPSFEPQAAPAPIPRIAEVRLTGGGHALLVTAPGAHSLGRAKDAALRIDNATVSRKHARIILSDDRSTAYVQDLGGANGTLLNGVELRELKPLQEGDMIRVGEVELKVSIQRV